MTTGNAASIIRSFANERRLRCGLPEKRQDHGPRWHAAAADTGDPRQSSAHLRIECHAFTGQLVTQDPDVEPAAGLLKRIAAEREERTRLLAAARKPNTSARRARRKTS